MKYTRSNKNRPCEICSDIKGKCGVSPSKPDLKMCMTHVGGSYVPDGWRYLKDSKNGLWGLFAPDIMRIRTTEEKAAWGKQQREKELERKRAEADRLADLPPDAIRDRQYRADLTRYGLSDRDKEMIRDRGFSDSQVEGLAYNNGKELRFLIKNLNGLFVGHQIYTYSAPKYLWGNVGNNDRRNTGKKPLQHIGNRNNPTQIRFSEGLFFKQIHDSAKNPDALCIGASGGAFGASDSEIIESISQYPNAELVLTPDAGSVSNSSVMLRYKQLNDIISGAGRELTIEWWGQFKKTDGDLDDIPASTKIRNISFNKFCNISKNYNKHIELSSLTHESEKIDLRYLPELPDLVAEQILFVSSNMGTGKTEQLGIAYRKHLRKHPESKVLFVTYRNALAEQMGERLGISPYKTGHGQDEVALNHQQSAVIVADSICKLRLSSIPPNSLIVLDECEAVLAHIAEGGTTGYDAPKVQAHFTQILDRVAVTGGSVIALEDSITNISVNSLMLLTNNKYSHKVISNSHNPFNYDVHIGGGSVRDFIALNLAWLQMGEKVLCVTTSQVFAEIISEMARRKIPMTEGCIERLDSKTIDKKKDLLRDPVYYFIDKKTRLVTLSPVVESGCNIDDKGLEKPLFDRVMAYFPNLDTRLHMQLLNRYRGNAPRYIFGVNRSADATDGGMTPEAILKKWNANATETTVALGRGKLKQTAEGNAWDRISAEFKARKNISHAYSLSLLKSELAARGHKCVDVDWKALAVETYSANGLDMYDGKDIAQAYKDIKAAIERASADEIAIANPGMMTVEQAIRISKSAETSYEQKVVAKKCLLQHDYPGTSLDDPDFVLNAIVKDRGRIAKTAKMRMVMSDRKLATALDKEIYGKLEQLPHINKKHVPVNTLTHDLFAPIKQELDLLVSGCQYRRDDAEVKRVSEYLIKRKNEIYRLLGLSMCEEVPGAAHTTPIANVNKVLKKLGYDVKCKHQLAEGKNRPRTYAVTNFDCTYTKQIMDSLKLKYKELMTATNEVSNKDIYTETSFVDSDELASYQAYSDNARLLLLVCDHPEEYGLYRSVLTDEDLTAASKELPNYRRQELKKIVVEYNKKAA